MLDRCQVMVEMGDRRLSRAGQERSMIPWERVSSLKRHDDVAGGCDLRLFGEEKEVAGGCSDAV